MNILSLKEVKREDIDSIGEKAYLLGELSSKNLPIPPAFILTNKVFEKFLKLNHLDTKIPSLLIDINLNNEKELRIISENINDLIMKAEFPRSIEEDILEAYESMNINPLLFKEVGSKALDIIKIGRDLPFVVIRNSIILNELKPGLKENAILNIKGNKNVINAIKKAYSFLYNFEALLQRKNDNIPNKDVSTSLIIQKQLQPIKCGLVLVNNNEVTIKAAYGSGKVLKENKEVLDSYQIDKFSRNLKEVEVNKQEYMYGLDINIFKTKRKRVEDNENNIRKLNDFEINKVMEILTKVEELYKKPMEIEFAIEGNNIFILNIDNLKEEIKELKEEVIEDNIPLDAFLLNSNNLNDELKEKAVNTDKEVWIKLSKDKEKLKEQINNISKRSITNDNYN